MTDTRRHFVPVDGATLCVRDDGPVAGSCVLMAHSIMTDGRMWDAQAAHLVGLGYRVLRLDSRGHGGSTCGPAPLTIDRLAADVVQVLDALGVARSHFVGLSLGGMVGFALGQQHAGRLASLVICDARADSPPGFAQPWDERIALARGQGMAALVEPTLQRWFGDRLATLDASAQASLRDAIASTSVDGFVATARALQAFDYTAKLGAMPAQATLVVGSEDGILPGVMEDLARRMPQAVLEVIPGTGHLPNAEKPEAFNAILERALQRGTR